MNFGVRAKLFTSFGTLIALIAGVGFVGWQNTQQLAADAENIYSDKLIGATNLANTRATFWNLRWNVPQYIVEPEERKNILAQEQELQQKINVSLENYRKTELSPQEKEGLAKLEKTYKVYIAARPRYFDLVDANKIPEATEYRAKNMSPVAQETVDSVSNLINLQQKEGEDKYQEVQNKINTLTTIITISLFSSLTLATVLAIFLGRNITEIVLNSVKNITTNSGKIATTVSDQERTLLQQSSSVNETTTTIEELGHFSLKSAEQADNSATQAQQALYLAEGGTVTVGRTIESISELKDQVSAIANQIVRLSEQTAQISLVSDLVADLANQTNMLALNAGVEAARAGEGGKGFAVVASEIRKLADQSKKSAEQIHALVNEVQGAINSTIMVTDQGTKKAAMGIHMAQETGETFTSIADGLNSVFLNSQQIAQTAKHQAVAVQQIVSAMNAINLGAKETVAGINYVKEATDDLNLAAKHLQTVV